jgi:hypothetical protein
VGGSAGHRGRVARGAAHHPAALDLVQAELDRANARLGQAEQAKKFFILERDLS